jgi:hypothetical protein
MRVHPALPLTTLPLPLPSRIVSFQRPNFHTCRESKLVVGLYIFTARGRENLVTANWHVKDQLQNISLDQIYRTTPSFKISA